MILAQSPEMEAVLRTSGLVAATDTTVLILGENGTGKELMARHIHEASGRRNGPFVVINCAALPEQLAESELFGHHKGAFTGASQQYEGRIPAAEGGTVFLDEIGELSLAMQAKLLRFLENGECQSLGSTRPVKINVRVLAATNRDLAAEVQAGRFRQDLFYRLNIIPVQLPALRQRQGDIPMLVQRLSQAFAQAYGVAAPRFGKSAMQVLEQFAWPGNVRELKNFCERMTILMPGQTIEVSNLPPEMQAPATRSNNITLPEGGVVLDEVEADLIRQALSMTDGNQSKAARLLGVTRSALIYRMQKYAL